METELKVVQWYSEERSEEIDEITKALAKVQGALEGANKDAKVGYDTKKGGAVKFKYADLKSVWEVLRKPLSENALAVFQTINAGYLSTTLAHESGQWFRSSYKLPAYSTMQALGSLITYMRRYQLQSLTGVYGEDDDGQAATANSPDAPIDEKTGKPKTLPKRPDDLKERLRLHDAVKARLGDFRAAFPDKAPAIEDFLKKDHSPEIYQQTINKMDRAIAGVDAQRDTLELTVVEGEVMDKDNPDSPDYDPFG